MSENKKSFKWEGIDTGGNRRSGTVQAAGIKEAQLELLHQGVEVIKVTPQKGFTFTKLNLTSKRENITTKDILLLTRYITTMLSAGLPVVQALDILAKDAENPAMREMLTNIKNNVAGGKTMADSFALYPQHFGDLYCNLIRAGEKSGTLEAILKRLTEYIERSEMLKKKVKKAMVYPIVILSVALIVSLVLLLFVVPQFEKMFSSFGADLPFFTRMIVTASEFIRAWWWLIVGGVVGGVWALKRHVKNSLSAQWFIDRKILKVYVVGDVIKKSIIARFTRTLATTLDAGMPVVDSMKSMASVMGNKVYEKAILEVCHDVVSGKQLSVSMQNTGVFPNMAVQMVAVGETSGSLGEMLNKIADYYEDEVNSIVDNLSSLLEPIIMIILGLIVGGFVVAMYLPIFRIGSLF